MDCWKLYEGRLVPLKERLYIMWFAAVLALNYVVPFVLLKDAKGFELYAFWFILALVHFIVSIVYLRTRGGALK